MLWQFNCRVVHLFPFLYIFRKFLGKYFVLIYGIVLFVIAISKPLEKIELLSEIGKKSLYLCGFEQVSKLVLANLQWAIGLQYNLITPITTIIYTIICILFAYFCFANPFSKIYNSIRELGIKVIMK